MTDPILELSSVTKDFGGLTAIDRVDLSVDDGEILGLIGPNGAGKSTLFKLIFGVLPVSDGTISFNGAEITDEPTHEIAERGIAQFYQESTLMDDVTVRDNVRVSVVPNSLRKFRTSRRRSDLVDETLAMANLTHVADEKPADLTHKEKQQLELAKAIACEPSLLLLDEPFAGLTKDEADEIVDIIETLNHDGVTICIVDHNLRWLRSFVDRIVVLNYGQIIANGPPSEIVTDEEVQSAYIGERSEEVTDA
ncbi:ABC transporter ATP-binding protein [Natrinema sp. 1APR25-10V2]|uniref:ABC transporter ATP-binding protein n=1 Tax=Natrinema sp. 1APR25-10V2 TaxID=2951081 RepID=UPI00287506DC|nr:ABC transporter ATP-binding protein [Natrinema sp. 1APR25-10V2]MDS0475879.1 ABC transporter ATP-binding protein [Natrinema sp. 1APR25-10V2]